MGDAGVIGPPIVVGVGITEDEVDMVRLGDPAGEPFWFMLKFILEALGERDPVLGPVGAR